MKMIRFSKFFLPAVVLSSVLVIVGIAGYIAFGFNLGIDFQAGLMQEVRFAPAAFSMTYAGRGSATVSIDRGGIAIVLSGSAVESARHYFDFARYDTVSSLAGAMNSEVEGLRASVSLPGDIPSAWLINSAQGSPQLGRDPYTVHYIAPGSAEIPIQDVRDALAGFGRSVSVQQLGDPADRHYMIRLSEEGEEGADPVKDGSDPVQADKIIGALEGFFGRGEVALVRSDYVGSRFSKNLTDQAGLLLALTLVLILIYSSIRFKPQYAAGAVLAIIHDSLIMVAFVVWTRMEFNTTTIAAVLTILGYSINDTIVIFDRIRETRRVYPEDSFINILNRSLSETLSRTIITTITTLLAVMSLFIFTSGSMKDFAQALLVGMISGVYSTIFIASGFVYFWEVQKNKRQKAALAPRT
jgi:preprotein translocase subunit SecF